MHHYEKVVNGGDIVCFVVSACNLRRPWLECIGQKQAQVCLTKARLKDENFTKTARLSDLTEQTLDR